MIFLTGLILFLISGVTLLSLAWKEHPYDNKVYFFSLAFVVGLTLMFCSTALLIVRHMP